MSATVTLVVDNYPSGVDNTQRLIYLRGQLIVNAGTYPTGGLALTWEGALDSANKAINIPVGPAALNAPVQVSFFSNGVVANATASLVVGGFEYTWNKATNKFQILAASGGSAGTGPINEEMTNGTTIPGNFTSDVIRFEAVFVRSYN